MKSAGQIADAVLTKIAASEEKEEKGFQGLPWWTPLAASGALGLGSYGLARIPFKASMKKYPGLRKIQDLSKGDMVRSDVLGLHNKKYKDLSGWEKLKRMVKYGPEEDAAEIARKAAKSKSKDPRAVWSGAEGLPKGSFNPAYGTTTKIDDVYDMEDVAIDLRDKLTEARMLEKAAPGTSARSLSLEDLKKKYGPEFPEQLIADDDYLNFQKILKKEFGDKGFIIKPRGAREGGDPGLASSGKFLSDETDFLKARDQWAKMKPEYEAARKAREEAKKGINPVVEKFRTKPGYEGRVLDEIPYGNVVVQEKLPLLQHDPAIAAKMKAKGYAPTQENRVHVVGGRAIPSLAMQRYPAFHPRAIIDYLKARKSATWAQKEIVDRLPGKYKGLHYSMDIAPLKGGGYRALETNPGVGSGLLDNPVGSHMLHRAVTGRFSRPAAAMLGGVGVAAGAGAGAVAQQVAEPTPPAAQEKPQQKERRWPSPSALLKKFDLSFR